MRGQVSEKLQTSGNVAHEDSRGYDPAMLRRVLVTGAAFLLLGASASAAAHPVLSVKGRQTMTVTGRHFSAGERVRVSLSPAPRHGVRHVRASGRGTFKVTYHDVPGGPCDGYSIVAIGDRGSRARFMRMRPNCLVHDR